MIRVACNADAFGPRQPGDGRVEARMAPEPLYQRINSPVTKKIISGEDSSSPYSDQKIVEILAQQDIKIARRTVAKYREMLGILSSSKRKKYY